MQKTQVKQFEMFVRVCSFENLHQALFPEGGEARKAFAALAAAIADIVGLRHESRTARRLSKKAKLDAKRSLMAAIADIQRAARVMAKTTPDADARFPPPRGTAEAEVLQTGRLFLKEAEPMKDAFISSGLPATFMDDLSAAVDAFEKGIAGRQAGKTGSKVSQQSIQRALRRGMDAVDSLDVFVPIALRSNQAALDAWRLERRIERVNPGRSTSAKPVSPAGEPATPVEPPAAPAGPSSAAAGDVTPVTVAAEALPKAS